METIDMMVRNAKTLSEANIDWSLTAGPIWLAGMAAIAGVVLVIGMIDEARRAR